MLQGFTSWDTFGFHTRRSLTCQEVLANIFLILDVRMDLLAGAYHSPRQMGKGVAIA